MVAMRRYRQINALLLLIIVGPATMVSSALLDSEDGQLPMPSNSRRSRRGRRVIVRLHLVRHGETEANRDNFVLGQRESPLTAKGISQAAALGKSIGRYPFWKAYSSDYERTRTTAAIILGGGDATAAANDGGGDESAGEERRTFVSRTAATSSEEVRNGEETTAVATASVREVEVLPKGDAVPPVDLVDAVIPDKRLRERAKGVREGRPKSLSFEEALALFRAEHGEDEGLPLLESDDDVWERVKSWIDDLVRDASTDDDGGIGPSGAEEELSDEKGLYQTLVDSAGREYERNTDSLIEREAEEEDRGGAVDPRSDGYYRRHNIYDVLAVSHSATIRTAVNRLVGDQLPSSIVRGSGGADGAAAGQLIVPNTSRTIIDVVVDGSKDVAESSNDGGGDQRDRSVDTPPWSAKLVDLTNTDHFSRQS